MCKILPVKGKEDFFEIEQIDARYNFPHIGGDSSAGYNPQTKPINLNFPGCKSLSTWAIVSSPKLQSSHQLL